MLSLFPSSFHLLSFHAITPHGKKCFISVFVYNSLPVWDVMVGNSTNNRDCQTASVETVNREPFTAFKEVTGSPGICIFQHTSGYSTQEFCLHRAWGLSCFLCFSSISNHLMAWVRMEAHSELLLWRTNSKPGRRGGGLHTKTVSFPVIVSATSKRECQAQRTHFHC